MTDIDPTYESLVAKLRAANLTSEEEELLDAILAVAGQVVSMETRQLATIDVEFDDSFTPEKADLLRAYVAGPGATSGTDASPTVGVVPAMVVKGISRTDASKGISRT